MSDLKREVWIAEWHDKHGKGNLSGYAFHSEDAAKSHIAQQLAEDEIRAKNGRARAWEGATWTTSRFVPAEPEQAGKAQDAATLLQLLRWAAGPNRQVWSGDADSWYAIDGDLFLSGETPEGLAQLLGIPDPLPAPPTKDPTNG